MISVYDRRPNPGTFVAFDEMKPNGRQQDGRLRVREYEKEKERGREIDR